MVSLGDPAEDTPVNAEGDSDGSSLERAAFTLPVDHGSTHVFVRVWRVADSRLPPVVLLHDLGASVEGLRRLAQQLAAGGVSCYAFDLRGHGRSGARLGHLTRFHQLVADLLQVVAWVHHVEGGRLPVLIADHLAGLVALDFAAHYGGWLCALALIRPELGEVPPLSWWDRVQVGLLSDVLPTRRSSARLHALALAGRPGGSAAAGGPSGGDEGGGGPQPGSPAEVGAGATRRSLNRSLNLSLAFVREILAKRATWRDIAQAAAHPLLVIDSVETAGVLAERPDFSNIIAERVELSRVAPPVVKALVEWLSHQPVVQRSPGRGGPGEADV